MEKFSDYLKEQLQDPDLKAEYDALEQEFAKCKPAGKTAPAPGRKHRKEPESKTRKV